MNVLFASHHCCIRVIKEGMALAKRGVNVHFMQSQFSNPYFPNVIPSCSFYSGPDNYANKLLQMQNFDLVHVHNEPDWLGHITKQVRPDLPVVFDAHDLFSARMGKSFPDEEKSFMDCDAFIYPSMPYMEHALRFHEAKGIRSKPNKVILSMGLKEFNDLPPMPRVNGIVYEGGLAVFEKSDAREHNYLYYRDYRETFLTLSRLGLAVFAIGANDRFVEAYQTTGCVYIHPLHYIQLLQTLSRFDWGFCGAPVKCTQWDWAMPNKLFDYICAGIPVLVHLADESAKFVEEHKIGIVVDSLEEIPRVYGYADKFRKNVAKIRGDFLMEGQVDDILEVYGEVIKNVRHDRARKRGAHQIFDFSKEDPGADLNFQTIPPGGLPGQGSMGSTVDPPA